MSKENSNKFDVVIVGGGMVGLTMALLLARDLGQDKVFKLALVDGQKKGQKKEQAGGEKDELNTVKKPQATKVNVNSFSPRVSALTLASQALFDSLDLWRDQIAPQACPYEDMYVWDAEGTGNINFSALDIQQLALGHIVENSVIIKALDEALGQQVAIKQFEGVPVSRYQAQRDNHILTLADGTEIHGKLIIAADGANSFIRQAAEFDVKAWSYEHQAIVTTVRTELSHNFTASQCFLTSGPLAFLPLLDGASGREAQFYSSIVWSCESEKAQRLMDMDQATFHVALQEAFESRLGAIQESSKRIAFPLWQRHATSYVKPGLALIGDAAHTVHPLAGQGVNLGLLDAECLCKVIRQALDKGEGFSSEQVLSRYQRQRKGHNLSMMTLMEAFKRGFGSDDLMLRWMRNVGLTFVDKARPIKHQLMKKVMGL
ncbi:UbiH/UbiF/VisC/COQ6 family ubiquinone biosynthesis hydroxylase [Gammaproteobacteria bacterium AH-315-E17]|nr:UbiH/UbiF/VisC/COQ6 family ubiquinone biosynthesis hydroxylase [Gammaproteobacteria bacterium AH-315-E17]